MSKERIKGASIKLGEKMIFGPGRWYSLTPLGSCLEGICSVQDYLRQLSNGVSEDKHEEWQAYIKEEFGRAEALIGGRLPEDIRDNLVQQHRTIVKERIDNVKKSNEE